MLMTIWFIKMVNLFIVIVISELSLGFMFSYKTY